MAIREQIRKASSEREINELLATGYKFQEVSQKTVRAWKSAARTRMNELSQSKTKDSSESKTTTPKKVAVAKKKPRSKASK